MRPRHPVSALGFPPPRTSPAPISRDGDVEPADGRPARMPAPTGASPPIVDRFRPRHVRRAECDGAAAPRVPLALFVSSCPDCRAARRLRARRGTSPRRSRPRPAAGLPVLPHDALPLRSPAARDAAGRAAPARPDRRRQEAQPTETVLERMTRRRFPACRSRGRSWRWPRARVLPPGSPSWGEAAPERTISPVRPREDAGRHALAGGAAPHRPRAEGGGGRMRGSWRQDAPAPAGPLAAAGNGKMPGRRRSGPPARRSPPWRQGDPSGGCQQRGWDDPRRGIDGAMRRTERSSPPVLRPGPARQAGAAGVRGPRRLLVKPVRRR